MVIRTHDVPQNPYIPLLFERSEFLIDTSQKKSLCVCARVILVKEGSLKRYCCRTLRQYDTRYVRTPYNIGLHPPPKKHRTPGNSERFVANCGVGPSTRGQGDSASLVKPTQDQRR